jgi:hypothetical protein
MLDARRTEFSDWAIVQGNPTVTQVHSGPVVSEEEEQALTKTKAFASAAIFTVGASPSSTANTWDADGLTLWILSCSIGRFLKASAILFHWELSQLENGRKQRLQEARLACGCT